MQILRIIRKFCNDVISALKVKNPIVIGHSMGGLVALDLSYN
jgi:pimeloyl-ACP methyl ester carboxylesterase